MTSAGELRHRIAFDKRAPTDDGYGNEVEDFVEQFVVAAKVAYLRGSEKVIAAMQTAVQPAILTVRMSSQTSQITSAWRARDVRSETVYAIHAVEPWEDGAWIDLVVASGEAA